MKEISSSIILQNSRGLKTMAQKVSAKGRSSRRSKVHKFAKVEIIDNIHSYKLQKSIDLSEKIKSGKNEMAKRKEQTRSNRAKFKAKRKAKHVFTV